MMVGLVVGARCNAACRHCSTSCGPTRQEALDAAVIRRVMDEAAAVPRDPAAPLAFCITGGEPFLDFPGLLELVAHGAALGAAMTCVTNGSWATSDERALGLLARLRSAGLRALGVSTSRFHREFVGPARVQRALAAARALGLHTVCKLALTRSDRAAGELEAWCRTLPADRLEIFDVLPFMRHGESLPDHEHARKPGLPGGRCPAPVLTVREDGEAHMCCTPGADGTFFSLGNVRREAVADLAEAFRLDERRRILDTEGPAAFARWIRRAGRGALLRDTYADVCDLCTHIGATPALRELADELVQRRRRARLDGMRKALCRRTPVRRPAEFTKAAPGRSIHGNEKTAR